MPPKPGNFSQKTENLALLLDKLMLLLSGWRLPEDIAMPTAQLRDHAKNALHQPLLGRREIRASSESGFSDEEQEILAQAKAWNPKEYFGYFEGFTTTAWGKRSVDRRKAAFSD